jgi:hypothetical protein
MRTIFQKRIWFPILCWLAFLTGNLLVGETEATFSSQVRVETITLSAEIVVPATILVDQAEEEKVLEDGKETLENNE